MSGLVFRVKCLLVLKSYIHNIKEAGGTGIITYAEGSVDSQTETMLKACVDNLIRLDGKEITIEAMMGLGKIKAHIKMQNEFISAQFFSEKKETLSLFQENFDFLRGRLNYNGLNVGNIECAHAKLSEDSLPVNTKRLDERI